MRVKTCKRCSWRRHWRAPPTHQDCLCSTPTTQEDFLNQCTERGPITVEFDFEPATEADLPRAASSPSSDRAWSHIAPAYRLGALTL